MKKLALITALSLVSLINLNAQGLPGRSFGTEDIGDIVSETFDKNHSILHREYISKKFLDRVKHSFVSDYEFEDSEMDHAIHYSDMFTEMDGLYLHKDDSEMLLSNGNTVYFRTYVMSFDPMIPVFKVILRSMDKDFSTIHSIFFIKKDGITFSDID